MPNRLVEYYLHACCLLILLTRYVSDDDILWTNPESIYIRLQLPYTSSSLNDSKYSIEITYGVFVPSQSCSSELASGLDVDLPCGNNHNWCVPATYRCDGIPNCPNAEDEAKCGGNGSAHNDYPNIYIEVWSFYFDMQRCTFSLHFFNVKTYEQL